MKKISIYGAGYVGLVTALGFVSLGHSVLCFDINEEKIDLLKRGIPPFYEKGIKELLSKAIKKQKIEFSCEEKDAVNFSNIHLICVGTPPRKDGSSDLSHIHNVVKSIAKHVKGPFYLLIKSTVPVGTSEKIKAKLTSLLKKQNKFFAFEVAFLPEFFQQGHAVSNFMNGNSVIVGTDSKEVCALTKELFKPLLDKKSIPFIQVSLNSAELIKYASNAFLATKISFINVISQIAENTKSNIKEVVKALTYDKRIGCLMANPGVGFGGSCLTKDLKALMHLTGKRRSSKSFLKSILEVNLFQRKLILKKLKKYFQGNLSNKTIGIWGLAFKPETDDLRDAISITIINQLLTEGARIQAYDPQAMANAKRLYARHPELRLMATKEEAIRDADALLILTEWDEFKKAKPNLFRQYLKEPLILDGRNIYDKAELNRHGITYFGIGES